MPCVVKIPVSGFHAITPLISNCESEVLAAATKRQVPLCSGKGTQTKKTSRTQRKKQKWTRKCRHRSVPITSPTEFYKSHLDTSRKHMNPIQKENLHPHPATSKHLWKPTQLQAMVLVHSADGSQSHHLPQPEKKRGFPEPQHKSHCTKSAQRSLQLSTPPAIVAKPSQNG